MSGIKTADGGTISYHNYKGSVGYYVYVPANVEADTPIFTYTYGGGKTSDLYSGYHEHGNYGIWDALIANGSDSIVVMPTMDWGADWGGNTIGIINSIREDYGITNLNVSGSGFSKGGFGGFDIVAANLKQNPELDPQVVFFIDDYSSTYYSANRKLTEENAQLFVENNTVFFAYDPYWKSADNYQTYLDAGINIIRVEPANFDHIAINANFFKNGIYDYMAGGTLPDEGYVYKVYNRETGTWEEIDYNQISTIDNLYAYYGINTSESLLERFADLFNFNLYEFGSDKSVADEYLNDIFSKIKNTSFLTTVLEAFGGSSTTQIPSQISACIEEYFAKVSSSLQNLSSLMTDIAKIHPTYEETDNNLISAIADSIFGNESSSDK